MAVDPKTGKPVADGGWAEIARSLARDFSRIRLLSPAEEASFYELFGLPAPVPDAATPLDVGRAFAEDLVRTGRITRAQAGAVAEDLARAAAADLTPPPADPRGVSPLLDAYGTWLAAQELLRGGRS